LFESRVHRTGGILSVFSRFRGLIAAFIAAGAVTVPSLALAAESPGGSGGSEVLLLAQVVVLVLLGRLLGELMYRLGQPTIIGQILAGILLGPTVLGSLWPAGQALLFPPSPEQNAMIAGLSQLGILFLLLLAGMETDLGLAYRLRRSALGVSLSGIAVPFACGFALGLLLPAGLLPDPDKRLVAALFLGTALSISSLKIVATVVREMNFMRRDVGQLIVASAVIDDTAGWVIIAITLGIATTGSVALVPLATAVIGTAIFLALAFTVGRRAAFELIRWTNDNLHSDLPVTTTIIGLMCVLALITAAIGVQTVLGAFIAGLLIGQSPILTRQIDEQLRGLTTALFMPVFFGLTGLHTDLRVLLDPETALLAAGLIVIASLGKFGGAFLGARLNGMGFREALALGFGMNARGSTEVIVASIGLSVGVIDERLFSVIVTMAIVTTLIMPPTLRWALSRLPIRDEEKERLAREEFEAESFISALERILLVADESANGKLAAILAGHLGGLRNMPVTVLELPKDAPHGEPPAPAADAAEQVKAASEESIARAKETDETREGTIHVETRPPPAELGEAIGAAVEKGHDLMLLGLERLASDEGGYDDRIKTALDAFRQSTVAVSGRGALRRSPDAALRMLVPITGDSRSMRAIEFASLIAQASGGTVAAIAVAREGDEEHSGPQLEAMFAHVREIGRHYEVDVKTIAGAGGRRELAILTHARRGRYNLIVLGVGRRAGDRLSLGSLADTLVETSDRSLALVITN
jgi:Kef-type K+ transport system membrane component KefB/nucleotide-binding universal stress UspA family protein